MASTPYPSPAEIWLEPECCPVDERSWSSVAQEDCTEGSCGLPWVRYIRADLVQAALDDAKLQDAFSFSWGWEAGREDLLRSEHDAGLSHGEHNEDH